MSIARAKSLRHNQTGPERAMWRLLWQFREDGWHFRRQQPIGPYYADFACMHAKLVIEVDGETHVSPERDAARDDYMRGRGIHVLRFSNDELFECTGRVLDRIEREVLRLREEKRGSPHSDQ